MGGSYFKDLFSLTLFPSIPQWEQLHSFKPVSHHPQEML